MVIGDELVITIKHPILRFFQKFKMEEKPNSESYILCVGMQTQMKSFDYPI